jgi:hypothetical protein
LILIGYATGIIIVRVANDGVTIEGPNSPNK